MPKIVVFTGAGLSKESGIPTYRGEGGLYEGTSLPDLLCAESYVSKPAEVNAFMDQRKAEVKKVEPNEAHFALRDLQQLTGAQIVTQNIDDLLERAGCTNVLHVHGELMRYRCKVCTLSVPEAELKEHCEICGGPMRYDVVLFDEEAPKYDTLNRMLHTLQDGDYFVVIGTSGVVININRMTHYLKLRGVKCILNNYREEENVSSENFDEVYFGNATTYVPTIVQKLIDRVK